MSNARRYRTRYEIFAEILEASQRPIKLTRITFICNLNPTTSRGHLIRLIEVDLIRVVGEPPTYETTDKGRRYLEAFHLVQQLLESRVRDRATSRKDEEVRT